MTTKTSNQNVPRSAVTYFEQTAHAIQMKPKGGSPVPDQLRRPSMTLIDSYAFKVHPRA